MAEQMRMQLGFFESLPSKARTHALEQGRNRIALKLFARLTDHEAICLEAPLRYDALSVVARVGAFAGSSRQVALAQPHVIGEYGGGFFRKRNEPPTRLPRLRRVHAHLHVGEVDVGV